ncbi:ankyrin [Imleria badia]|nr:ankyrin [Imleria badia]
MDDFSGFPLVSLDEMADGLAADIELHVTQELDTRQRLKDLDTEFKTEVHSVVCKKADGMFRWVQCSLDTLNRCVTREQVRDALNSLPKGLDETYERILRAINANAWEGQLAQRALVWLVVALRPLHLDELMEGLSINLHTRTLDSNFGPMHKGALLDACGSLVTIERTGLIILSHFSVKEYLTGKFTRSKLPRYHVDRGLAHLHLARFCMCYISIYINHPQRFSRSSDTALHVSRVCPDRGDYLHIMSQRLRDYVLDHAPDHFSHIGSHIGSILHDIKVLEQDAHSHSRIWDNMCLSANRVTRCTTPVWPTSRHDFTLYILVAFGPVSVLRKFLRRTGFRPTEGTNPLVYAAYFNKREHACTLLSRGARLNRTGWDIDGFCPVFPIEAAFRNHHYDIVTLFLAEGSPIPPCIFTMVYDRDHKQIPSRVIKKLLQTDDFAEDAESSRTELVSRTLALLHRFLSDDDITEKDFIAIIRRAIQVGCDPCEVIHRQDTLIRIAIQRGYVTVACYLLSLGLSFPSDLLVTSTLLALRNSARIFHFLVESGVVDLAHLSKEKNVLHMSLENFEEPEVLDAARLLVAHDCDPLEANSRGETPLHIAVQQGHVSVVHYLRSLGAPLPSNLPLAIFNLSRSRNCTRMIRCLIEYGADTLALTSHGDSVLHIVLAAFSEYDALETAELLVAQGCNPFQTNSYGKTPLRIAVERRHVSVARYLHSIGAPLSPDQLFSSISRGMRNDARMIRFLVENGFDILARAENGDSLLHITMYTLHEDRALETAKLLVLHGCNPLEANSDEDTPLHIALTRGYVSVVHYLLSLDIPLPSNLPDTMSFWCKETCARMIRCLVENGADALALTSDGDTLLNIVLANFDERDALETAKLLVAHRCDPLQANSRGEIPLSIAVKRRQVSVARYLLSLGASPTSDHPIPPILRGTQDDARMIFFLVENGFDVFSRTGPSGDPLLHVVMNTFREDEVLAVTKLLLAHGCDALQLNSRGETPIRIAIERGHDSLVRYLLSLGVPLPCDALFIALYSGRLEGDSLGRSEMVHFLVDQGANIFTRQSDGGSVLHAAIIAFPRDTDDPKPDVLDVITFLVVRGCDPAIPNTRGDTPLHVAVKQGDVMIVEHLLSLKAPLPSDILLTAIRSDLISSSHWHWVMHVIEVLVTSGCHPLARNGAGYTPLRAAVIMGYVPVVDYFLTVMDSPPSDDLFSAVALAPLTVRNEMMSMLNDRLARSESPDVTDLQPPAKRTRYS